VALAKFLLLDQDLLSVAADDGGARRTVVQLEESRKAAEQLRLEKERVQRERRKKKAQLERAARLTEVASRTEAVWQEIERLLLLASGASYTRAESVIVELAEALTAAGRRDEFDAALARQLAANGKRQGWRNRLRAAGLI
jgi:glyoxylate carboligase